MTMECAEELDLDTLAELLDEDFIENNFEDMVPANEEVKSLSSAGEIKVVREVPSSEKTCQFENSSKNIATKLTEVSVDLFSFETKEPTVDCSKTSLKDSVVHTGETDSSDDENKHQLTEKGKNIKKIISLPTNYGFSPQRRVIKTWKDELKSNDASKNIDNNLTTDSFSGIRIVNPRVSFDAMQQRMKGRRMIKMSFIRNFMRGGDIEDDWVTIGVVVSKLPPKTSKNGKTYSIWKMTDLHNVDKIISVFLFGATHTEHWKTAIGTVIGILNPSIMPDKDTPKNGEITLSVDHPGKFMVMGTAKDFGHCKGRRKDGTSCSMVVNLSQCDYCGYHVKKEYKKLSSKRTELQASYSGREPNLKNKVLKGQNFIYGGRMFTPSSDRKLTKAHSNKDKLTLSNLKLKRKAEVLESDERAKGIKKITEMYSPGLATVRTDSEFIKKQLTIPSAGSRNLAQHLVKDQVEKKQKTKIVSITPKELLKRHEEHLKEQKRIFEKGKSDDNVLLQNLMPQLGKGFKPGENISLDILVPAARKSFTFQDVIKLKAIKKIKENGPILKKDPNSVKCSTSNGIIEKVKASLRGSAEENIVEKLEGKVEPRSLLGDIDLNSKKIQEILKRKSSHAYEIEMDEIEKQETYFMHLEKKEEMEQKMESMTEIVCDVISCKQCKYTAHRALDLCKEQHHPLKCHKALKRFFVCKDCKHRTCAFTKLPTKPCRNCRGSNFERTGMMKPRSGPKLENETLSIRGDEIKFLNSFKTGVF